MGFELYVPSVLSPMLNPLQEGEASITRSGTGTFRPEDLAIVHIEGCVCILLDTGNLRIALRAANSDDLKSIRVSPSGKTNNRRKVNLAGALRRLGIEPKAASGRYNLTTKDNLLILDLGKCRA